MAEKIYEIDGGVGKTLEVFEDHAALTAKKNAKALLTGNILGGTKEFYYSDMTSVQYKAANTFLNGYVQFEYPGSHSGAKTAFGIGDNYGSENSFAFMKNKVSNEKMEEVVNYIKDKIKEAKKPQAATVVQQVSPAEELKKYKDLLDMDVITQEEFDAKKKELLNL